MDLDLAGSTLTTLLLAFAGVVTAVGLWVRARAEAAPRHAAAEEKMAGARKANAETRLIEAKTRAAEAEADREREEASGKHLLSAVNEAQQLRNEVAAARSDAHAANVRCMELEVARAHDNEECRVEIERANHQALHALTRANHAEQRCGDLERSVETLREALTRYQSKR